MGKWTVREKSESGHGAVLAVIENTDTGMVSVHILSGGPVFLTPDEVDQFRAGLGLASGAARGDKP